MRFSAILLGLILATVSGCGDDGSGSTMFFGKELIQFTDNGNSSFPAWSPDGDRIAYSFDQDIWMMPVEGGEATRLTTLLGQELRAYWYPGAGSSKLAFLNRTSDKFKIMTVDVNTLETAEIYATTASIDFPGFTSDGETIVFCGVTGGGGIRYLAADGSSEQPTQVENSDGWQTVGSVRPSPVGPALLYVERRGEDYNIYTTTLQGGKPTQLTSFQNLPSSKHQIWYADWSKDASRIAFSHSANIGTGGRSSAIYTMDPDGGNITGWTFDPYSSHEDIIIFDLPSFAPDNNRLAVLHASDIWIMVLK